MLLNIKRVLRLSLQIASEKFLILRRTERDVIKNYIDIHVKYLFLLSDFNEIWIFATGSRKNSQISNIMKIRPVGANGRTDERKDGQPWRSQ